MKIKVRVFFDVFMIIAWILMMGKIIILYTKDIQIESFDIVLIIILTILNEGRSIKYAINNHKTTNNGNQR